MRLLIFSMMMAPMMAMAALVDPALVNFARQEGGKVRVLALLEWKPTRPFPVGVRPGVLRQYLREEMAIALKRVKPALGDAIQSQQIGVRSVFAINLSFIADVTPQGLNVLAKAPGVSKIYMDRVIRGGEPTLRRPVPRFLEAAGMPYDLVAMGLDKVWQANPQLNGQGVLVGHIDTGVDGKHPALAGKVSVFFDAATGKVTEPHDTGDHGTHTAGTMIGNPKDGAPMGIAPGAKMVSAAGLQGYEAMLKAMEFMLDPDGKPETNDAPRLISNSWNCEGAPDLEAFYRGIAAWDSAGILPVFSAGNSGPSPRSITKPHEHPAAFAVAATGPDGLVANFSSRGPGVFNGQDIQKPDVSAPGVDIVSSVPGGRYEGMSGTSMAAPHAAGLATLLFQAAPALTSQKMRQIMIQSLDFTNEQGQAQQQMVWNAAYGFGKLNAVKALALVRNFAGGQERRWGTFMAPSLDMFRGFAAQSDLTLGFEKVEVKNPLDQGFVTDASKWVDGSSL